MNDLNQAIVLVRLILIEAEQKDLSHIAALARNVMSLLSQFTLEIEESDGSGEAEAPGHNQG